MDTKRFNHFITLAEEGRFASAAARVHLSQAAFSRSIQTLEEQAGMRLFDRGAKGATLTEAGEFFLERAKKVPGVQMVPGAAPAIGPLLWLAFNTKNPKLADKRVRQAISYAIDRRFILESLLGGLHKASTGPIASGSPFYTKDVETFAFNPTKAVQLLEAAGLKPGAGGVRLALEVDTIPGSSEIRTNTIRRSF